MFAIQQAMLGSHRFAQFRPATTKKKPVFFFFFFFFFWFCARAKGMRTKRSEANELKKREKTSEHKTKR
jgi:hypothetical protein